MDSFRAIPQTAMPRGEVVAKLTLHPQYLSKSAYPADLIADAGLRAIGSRTDHITPEKVSRQSGPSEEATATLFVAGTIEAFDTFSRRLQQSVTTFRSSVQEELTAIETVAPMLAADRLSPSLSLADVKVLECVLHMGGSEPDLGIVQAFERYAASLDLRVERGHNLFASGLCFLTVLGKISAAEQLAYFSYLRRVRPMPRMRPLLPSRIIRSATGVTVAVPQEPPLDPELKVAIFDSALPKSHALGHWVTSHEHGVQEYSDPDQAAHGLCVASAATLGPLNETSGGVSPYSVDHHAVLGESDEIEYLDTLRLVQEQIKATNPTMINISFGPDHPIEDDDIDAFTAMLDPLLSDGSKLAFIAVGNDGSATNLWA